MILGKLLEGLEYSLREGDIDVEISSIAYDSRKVTEGSLFVCLKGFETDGHRYIKNAVDAGAAAVIVEDVPEDETGVTVVKTEDTRGALARISAAWFDHPAEKMTMIGLTGTKGKTTTAHMIKKILEKDGRRTGMIGTLGAFVGPEKIPTKNTTPESYELHSIFDHMLSEGCSCVVMEVSSQGLKLERTAGITFDYGAFLNISPDHVGPGEHEDFDEYLNCKKMLFDQTENVVANIDDERWRQVTGEPERLYTVSQKEDADLTARNVENIWEPGVLGVRFDVSGMFDAGIVLNMPGRYNVENALVAAAITYLIGVSPDVIAEALKEVQVKGRMQIFEDSVHDARFIIDYAHNALSMENLLTTLREYEPERLICLFGGGGNKPKQRRFDMGEMAGKYADLTVITMDNPRFEPMEEINRDIIRGLDVHDGSYMVIDDREKAIKELIDNCREGDIVALIGKGHEEYQEVEGKKYFFSEQQILEKYLKEKRD